uniref:Uncharacterized protein n=1 Tax=Vespula pensylvanica TaxID=30213 RepID=A0A834P653_VESPE|nr:hypothetical protein H0235_006106 [Vespula pensylvanica]
MRTIMGFRIINLLYRVYYLNTVPGFLHGKLYWLKFAETFLILPKVQVKPYGIGKEEAIVNIGGSPSVVIARLISERGGVRETVAKKMEGYLQDGSCEEERGGEPSPFSPFQDDDVPSKTPPIGQLRCNRLEFNTNRKRTKANVLVTGVTLVNVNTKKDPLLSYQRDHNLEFVSGFNGGTRNNPLTSPTPVALTN